MNTGQANPMVSMLVTVYNREKYLAECLTSILDSTFEDYEVVVVDDCSTDRSVEIAEKFVEQDNRIRLFQNDHNLGDYPNRNRAAKLANGKYLKYLDADDMIYQHSLATMVEALEQFPGAALAFSSHVVDPQSPYPNLYTSTELYQSHFLRRSPLGAGPSAAIIRRECFEDVGGFSGKQFVGDTELWLKLAERWAVITLPPALVWWRQHGTQQMNLERRCPEVLDLRFKMEIGFLEATNHLSSTEKLFGLHRLQQHHARRILALAIRRGRPGEAWALFRKCGISIVGMLEGFRKYSS